MSVQSLLNLRKSTRHYDSNFVIPKEDLERLLSIATLAPSGNNSQPWRFVVINDKHLQHTLLPITYHQIQTLEASAIIIILADRHAYLSDNLTQIHQEEYEQGCFDETVREFLTQAAIGFYDSFDEIQLTKFLGIDIGLVAMSILLCAQEMGYHSIPMSGYDRQALRETFHINERYLDMMMIAIGKGVKIPHKTLRHPIEKVVKFNEFFE